MTHIILYIFFLAMYFGPALYALKDVENRFLIAFSIGIGVPILIGISCNIFFDVQSGNDIDMVMFYLSIFVIWLIWIWRAVIIYQDR